MARILDSSLRYASYRNDRLTCFSCKGLIGQEGGLEVGTFARHSEDAAAEGDGFLPSQE